MAFTKKVSLNLSIYFQCCKNKILYIFYDHIFLVSAYKHKSLDSIHIS